ncbi:DUF3301 domain-containing protein [Catenovulum sp. SX2]|uniref:DUF3301 domain-containing protein n=1 Tax=Catenovulum sp. SX2 TaxID=3398614 RepID=UPI003F83C5CB
MVQLIDILVIALLVAVILQFWLLRKQSEAALAYAQDYCERNGLQFVSVSRKQTRIKLFKRNLIEWHSQFAFEFSGNGEDLCQGQLTLIDQRLINVNAEAYRIN